MSTKQFLATPFPGKIHILEDCIETQGIGGTFDQSKDVVNSLSPREKEVLRMVTQDDWLGFSAFSPIDNKALKCDPPMFARNPR